MSMTQTDHNSYLSVNPDGKIETVIDKIEENYVFAKCYLFANREDTTYIVCESGVAEKRENESISQSCSHATNMAYKNAIARISGVSSFTEVEMKELKKLEVGLTTLPSTLSKETNTPVEQEPQELETPEITEPIIEATQAPTTEIVDENSTVVKLELNTQSSENQTNAHNYLDVVLDMLGRVNPCNGMTIREVLEKDPEVIVNFQPRYRGRNEIAKAALKEALPEAIRLCQTKQKRAA